MSVYKTSKSARADAAQKQKQMTGQLGRDINGATEQLLEELKAGKSKRLTDFLTFAARFHKYSEANQWAILVQRPDATHVAGYRTWEKMGYHVARGQRGIRIFAPRPYTAIDEETGDEESRVGFTTVAVFDASQLNAEERAAKPLPAFYIDLGSDEETERLYARMVRCLTAAGIRVEERAIGGGAQGWSAGKRVAVKSGLASRNRVRTLAHEWAHECLEHVANHDALTRSQREYQAEATSFVVLAHFGIHNDLSSDYLANWGATPEKLAAELGEVHRAAAHIIQAIEGDQVCNGNDVP